MSKPIAFAGPVHVSRRAARAMRTRWRAVHLTERRELQDASTSEKLRQLAALCESVRAFGWQGALAAEDTAVRERWRRLRQAHRG